MPVDGELDIPLSEGESSVPTQAEMLHEQNMSQLGQASVNTTFIGQLVLGDIKAVSKAQDYAHLAGTVSLEEAVGIREVTSKVTPGGPAPAA